MLDYEETTMTIICYYPKSCTMKKRNWSDDQRGSQAQRYPICRISAFG